MLHQRGPRRASSAASSTWPRRPPTSRRWDELVDALEHPEREVDIAMVGKYVDLTDVVQVADGGADPRRHPHARRCTSTTSTRKRSSADGVDAAARTWTASSCPAASASAASRARSRRSAIARENERAVPRHLPRHADRGDRDRAHTWRGSPAPTPPSSTPTTPHPVIALITEWQDHDGTIEKRDAQSDLGGTMRLGAQPCERGAGLARASHLRQRPIVDERHRHRYEVNNHYLSRVEAAGLAVVARAKSAVPATSCEIDRAAGPSVVPRRAVPPRVHVEAARRAPAVRSFVGRRSTRAQVRARGAAVRLAARLVGRRFERGR